MYEVDLPIQEPSTTWLDLKMPIWKLNHPPASSQVYLSLFGFSVFAFTLDICFYFENIRAKVHWRLQRFSHVSTEFKIIQLKI